MMHFSSLISYQINFLIKSLNDSNYDSIHRELRQLVEHGSEARMILLQLCLDQVNYYSQDGQNSQAEQDLLSSIFKYILDKPDFSATFGEAVGSAVMSEGFLADLSNRFNLSTAEKIGVGLALSESETPNLRTEGQNFSIVQIEKLCANPTSAISHKQIQDVVLFLYQSEGLSTHVVSFTNLLLLVRLIINDIFLPSPVLSDDTGGVNSLRQMDLFVELSDHDFESVLAEIEKEMSMADVIMELGYECTSKISHCREMLSLFLPLNEVTLSKLLGIIAHTCIGLDGTQNIHSVLCSALECISFCKSPVPSSWNVDVLVDSIMQLAPMTSWISVMENLDHEGFNIPDDLSFSLLMAIYTKACQDPFPLHVICGSVWKNAEGQLSFLRHAVSAPSDVFTFAHCSRKLTHVDLAYLSQCDEDQAWLCLDLLNVFCQLAERGQINSVRLILESPLDKCPEVLLIGLAQINTPYNLLQYEVSSIVFPDMLSDPTKIDVVHFLWRVNPNMVLRSFSEYISTDPNNLLRIVNICQELKIMSSILDKTPSPVSIQLAAVAYRKESLILENWLIENMRIYKVAFFEDCLKFLKVIFCDVDKDAPDMSLRQLLYAILNDYQETYSVIFKVLQLHAREPSLRQFSEELQGLIIVSNSKHQSPVSSNVVGSNGITDSLKAEANSYFDYMFSGQLTIDAMVEKLACFKESSEKREQLLFNYMIANVFAEYNFFPNYAEGQLILAGMLFGSLIKHQLLNYLQLDVALRGVLDALRKSIDSKMFIFGVKALGQFIDRLVEWPQYCNFILQLSDLRGTHPELVSVVERARPICSSSHEASNAECSVPADQQLGTLSPTSSQSMELLEASSQLAGLSSSLLEQQIFSFELQHIHQGFLPDQLKSSAIAANCAKSHPSDVQIVCLPPTPTDSFTNLMVTTQSLHAPSFEKSAPVPYAVSSSSCLLLSSHGTTAADLVRKSSYGPGFGAALNIETLVAAAEGKDTPVEVPASEVQDKILFLINNMSTTNIDSKARDFNEVFTEQYHPWFAQYMVMKRVSIEPNFHDVYLKFLEKVNSKSLNKEIVKATYENCKVLLRSQLIKSSSEERSLLKNLGSWLGKFTIGRNKALLAKEIDPKVLIIEAYEKGLMIAVIPFTSKILEPCYNSLAYKPPNPWTMGILGLLAEIYNSRNLKLNLKFDIEVLFKNLGLDIKTVTQTCFLKDRVREVEGNPDFSNKDTSLAGAWGMFDVDSSPKQTNNHLELHPECAASSQISHTTIVEDEGALIVPEHVRPAQGFTQAIPTCSLSQLLKSVPGWDQHKNIDSMVSLLQNSIVPGIMDMAIKEIIPHVTRHTIAVTIQTTKELVTKDYAMETDVCVAIRAARLMVGNLAGNLAYATSLGHLQMLLSNRLRRLLQTINFNGESVDQIIQFLTTTNLYVGCGRIKKIASEKAMEMIDEQIVSAFTTIRQQREIAGSAHVHTFSSGSLTHNSEALCLKRGCLSVAQKQVYNDFRRNLGESSCNDSSTVLPAGPPTASVSLSNSAEMNSDIVLAPKITPAQPAHLIQPNQSAQFSSSTTFSGSNDYVLQPIAGAISVASFPASVASNELAMVEASRLVKDAGADIVLSPISLHMEAAVSETSSTARNSMDDYKCLEQEVSSLFSRWCQSSDNPATCHTVYAQFISLLQQIGFFRSGDIVDWLFQFLAELSVANCPALERAKTPDSLPIQSSQIHQLQYESIDAFAKLVVLILKNTVADLRSSKVLLDKILTVIISVIRKDAEKKLTLFNPRPYFRLFVNWFEDLASDSVPDANKFQVLSSFASAFHELHPEKVPSFSFCWVDLVCHRSFMPKLLTINSLSGWLPFKCLLVDLFEFMGPYLRDAKLDEPILVLYKGTLRVLLILFHDFPEFLSSFHFSFCDVIPHNCIQMRNLILTASPSNMKIPDPLTPNLKIDLLPEMCVDPCVLCDVDGALTAKQIKIDIDKYLKTGPEGSTFLTGLYQTLLLSQRESSLLGTVYDVQLINSLVLYVGMQDIQRLLGKHTIQPSPTSQMANSLVDIFRNGASMNIFASLVNNLDEEGRYYFLNAVSNQLRFPSSHTCYFSSVLLSLFGTCQENIQEQITRVLLERCIAGAPLPWGLLATYVELSTNPKYDFWNRPFVQRAPEIKDLLEKVMVMCHDPTDGIRRVPVTNK